MLSQLTRIAQRQRLCAALGQFVNIAGGRCVVLMFRCVLDFFEVNLTSILNPGFRMAATYVKMTCELFQVLGATKPLFLKRD